jgi:hypothetical protein
MPGEDARTVVDQRDPLRRAGHHFPFQKNIHHPRQDFIDC